MNNRRKAVLTVYLALILPLLLSFVLALFWGARVHAERMKAELVTDIAGNAVLGEYNKELRKQYGLLFVDTAYNLGYGGAGNLEDRISYYLEGNTGSDLAGSLLNMTNYSELSVTENLLTHYTLATDCNTQVMQRQILEYMESEPLEAAVSSMGAQTAEAEGILAGQVADGFDATSEDNPILDFAIDNFGRVSEVFDSHSDVDTGGLGAGDVRDQLPGDGLGSLEGLKGKSKEEKAGIILSMVVSDTSSLSRASFDESSVYSGRDNRKGLGVDPSINVSWGEKLLLNEYIFEKLGCYGDEKDNSHMAYEIEYLIGQKNSDIKNLSKVVMWLLTMRMVIDFLYVLQVGTEPNTVVNSIAESICGIFPVALPLYEVIVGVLAIIWGFIEARNDVSILMSGGKVPVLKDPSSWKTDIDSIASGSMGSNAAGLDYKGYLRVMISLRQTLGTSALIKRAMDIMELDIRKAGYEKFRLDDCIESFGLQVVFAGGSGLDTTVVRDFTFVKE
ncbi:DUF5702 domain-containing protein [Butyrivibrio sp. MC2013]|uniref:DUF5702 domain-containing protein n=1 Tax=Butyrivibrio sp. MC2013 TaxID=1280686 RepID=UPI000415165B|nr:DUF5702 domain-containing protein [Butyrivibrio sp. MC2013]